MWHTDRTGAFSTCSVPVLGWCGQFGGYNKISDLACHDSICYRAGSCGGVCIPWVDTWCIYECRYESCSVHKQSVLCTASFLTWFCPLWILLWLCICPYKDCNWQYGIFMVMHLIFNAINVAVSYAGMIMIPGWFLIGAFIVGVIGFIVLCIFFFKKNPVELQVSGYKGRQLVTKEGYITMAVCLCVTGMLLMI